MGKVILGMTMSLDGFINDRDGSVAELYPDLNELRNTESLQESILNTGAVVMGRNSFAMAEDPDWFAGNYEYQVPIFVLTHQPPKKQPRETDMLTFTFVMDGIESAIHQAQLVAGDKEVNVIGAGSTGSSVSGRGWQMNCTSTSCQYFLAVVSGHLKRSVANKSNWKESK